MASNILSSELKSGRVLPKCVSVILFGS